jgi:hypothetical protein
MSLRGLGVQTCNSVNHHTVLISVDLGIFPGVKWLEREADKKGPLVRS